MYKCRVDGCDREFESARGRATHEHWHKKSYRKLMAKANSEGTTRAWKDTEYRAKMSEAHSDRWKDPDNIRASSLTRIRQLQDLESSWNANNARYGIRGYHISPKAGKIHYRSDRELAAYQLLDQMTPVVRYWVELHVVPYPDMNSGPYHTLVDITVHYNCLLYTSPSPRDS